MIYTAKLKTRQEMRRDIPSVELGWWHDVCPGQTLELREATAEDLARCTLREGTSRDPADYLCENFEGGSLVSRKAVAVLTPWPEEAMQRGVRQAIQKFGADRFSAELATERTVGVDPGNSDKTAYWNSDGHSCEAAMNSEGQCSQCGRQVLPAAVEMAALLADAEGALKLAYKFIRNGVEFNYIQDTKDPDWRGTLRQLQSAIDALEAAHGVGAAHDQPKPPAPTAEGSRHE